MARFTVLSWNVENLNVPNKDIGRIVQHVRGCDPDVFALIEVVGAGVYQHIATRFPNYTFHLTYGRQSQEILVGVRNTIQAFFTQKTEFKAGNAYLRPGAMLTLTFGNTPYNLLFLHLHLHRRRCLPASRTALRPDRDSGDHPARADHLHFPYPDPLQHPAGRTGGGVEALRRQLHPQASLLLCAGPGGDQETDHGPLRGRRAIRGIRLDRGGDRHRLLSPRAAHQGRIHRARVAGYRLHKDPRRRGA